MEIKKDEIDQIIKQYGINDYKWIIPQENIIVSSWVRFRCQFGCADYGKNATCPPAAPSIDECRKMIYEYENAIIFHSPIEPNNNELNKLMSTLYELERAIFLNGYYKVFLLQYASCKLCKKCIAEDTRIECINKSKSRPEPTAMGIDVYQTAHNVGYQVQVVKNFDEIQNRFAFMLIN